MRARSCLGSAHAKGADRAVHQKAYGDGEAASKDAADHNAAMMTGTDRTAEATHATGRTAATKVATVHTAAEAASPNSGVAEMAAAEIEGSKVLRLLKLLGRTLLVKVWLGRHKLRIFIWGRQHRTSCKIRSFSCSSSFGGFVGHILL